MMIACMNEHYKRLFISQYPKFINALCYIKKACAITNCRLAQLPVERKEAIVLACDEILDGKHHGHFVVDMVQGGAGTSTNMVCLRTEFYP